MPTDATPWALETGRRTRRGTVIAGAVLVAVVVAAWGAVAWSGPQRQVPIPDSDATPKQVVLAYLDAIDARDFDTANAIDDRPDSDLGRFSRAQGIENVVIVRVDGNGQTAAHVLFEADFSGGDGSMQEGRQLWGYVLERGDGGDRWHIVDAGIV